MSVNICALMGRICHDLEVKTTTNGVFVLRFRLAVDRAYTPKGEEKKTDFIDCLAWRNTAEFIDRYFNKGSMIAVVGSIQTSEFTDKDGNKRKQVEVVVDNASFCGGKQDSAVEAATNAPTNNSAIISFVNDAKKQDIPVSYEEVIADDDLPF